MSAEKFMSREPNSLDFYPKSIVSTQEGSTERPSVKKSGKGQSIAEYLKSLEFPKNKES